MRVEHGSRHAGTDADPTDAATDRFAGSGSRFKERVVDVAEAYGYDYVGATPPPWVPVMPDTAPRLRVRRPDSTARSSRPRRSPGAASDRWSRTLRRGALAVVGA